MSTQKKIEALSMIAKGFSMLSEAEAEIAEHLSVGYPVSEPTKTKVEIKADEVSINEPSQVKGDGLDEMNLLELKTLAKDLKITVPKNIDKDGLISLIRNNGAKETNEVVSDKKEIPENLTRGKKAISPVKKSEEVVLPEDETMKQLLKETQDMEDDEIRDLLADAGISEKGGRNALLAKLYEAVKDGAISLEEDGDEDEVVSVDSNERKEIDTEDTFDISKFTSDKDTKERQQAILKFVQEADVDFDKGKLSVQKLRDHLKENFDVTLPKKATPADILDKYIEYAIKFIDDDGNTVKEGAYYIQGVPYCCGEPLEISKDDAGNDIATCHICDSVYDFED